MDAVIKALIGAVRSLVHPIILMILLVPMLVALAIWIGVGWAYWDTWTSAIGNAVVDNATFTWVANWDLARLASWIAAALVIAILAPMVIITALLIATVFAMPVLVRHVAKSDYPNLDRRHGGTVIGSVWNALAAIFLFATLVDCDVAALAAGSVGGAFAAVVVGVPEPAAVSLRRLVRPCRCSGDEADS